VSPTDEGDSIETALLQMVMTRLWRQATVVDDERVMAKSSLDALGGARNVVKLHLYERLDDLDANGKTIAASLFRELVTPSGAKIAHTTDDLVSFAKQPADRVIPVLEHLARARLLRRVDPPERYEIFHDALASAILDWCAEYLQEAERKSAARLRNRRLALIAGVALAVVGSAAGVYYFREARREGLLAQLSEARAQKAEQLQEAAGQAQASAERSKEEAQLTLQKGQLQLESMEAKVAGQLGREAQLLAQAKTVDTSIAQARQASAESSRQAQSQLDAAALTQKRIDTLNAEIEPKNVPTAAQLPGPDSTVAVALPAPAPGPEQPKSAPGAADAPKPSSAATTPAPAAPSTKAPAPVTGDYKTIYRQAINARDRKQFPEAAKLFQTAASLKADSGEIIAMPGFGDDQRYLPYYNLGLALQNMKDCAGAMQAWTRAEQAGAVQKSSSDYDALKRHRAECGSK
jgi:hypothetical protein